MILNMLELYAKRSQNMSLVGLVTINKILWCPILMVDSNSLTVNRLTHSLKCHSTQYNRSNIVSEFTL